MRWWGCVPRSLRPKLEPLFRRAAMCRLAERGGGGGISLPGPRGLLAPVASFAAGGINPRGLFAYHSSSAAAALEEWVTWPFWAGARNIRLRMFGAAGGGIGWLACLRCLRASEPSDAEQPVERGQSSESGVPLDYGFAANAAQRSGPFVKPAGV